MRSNKRYDLIIDVKTNRAPACSERALKPNGVYTTVGEPIRNLLRVALSGLRLNRARDKKLRVIALQANRDLAYFNELFEAGKFEPVIDTEFTFTDNDVRDASRDFDAAALKGKIVVGM